MRFLALAVPMLAVGTAHADHGVTRHRLAHAAVTVSLVGVYAVAELGFYDQLAPARCRWCSTNGLDRGVRDALVWGNTDRARTLSDVTAYGAVPILAAAAAIVDAQGELAETVDVVLPIVESVAAAEVATDLVKFSVGRARPDAANNLSFVSGHTSFAFATITSAAILARWRHSPTEPYLWAIGMPLAATAAYLRMAGNKHYLTDVVGGAALGIAAGYLVPRFGWRCRVEIVPQPNGVTVAGAW